MTILIAEDEEFTRRILVDIITKAPEGYRVIAVEDGAEAWQKLQSNDVSLVILDVAMPRMDGLEVLRRIRQSEEHRHLPVLMCSSRKDRATIIRAASFQVSDYIVKPPVAETVLEKVKRLGAGPVSAAWRSAASAPVKAGDLDEARLMAVKLNLARAITEWLAQARKADRWSEIKVLGLRAARLSVVARDLGVTDLACQLASVESSFAACASSAVGGGDDVKGHARRDEVLLLVDRVQAEMGVLLAGGK